MDRDKCVESQTHWCTQSFRCLEAQTHNQRSRPTHARTTTYTHTLHWGYLNTHKHMQRQTGREAHVHWEADIHTRQVAGSPVINLPAQLINWFPRGVAGASLKPCWRAPSAAQHSHRAFESAAPWRMTGGNNCLNCRMWPDSHVWPLCCVWLERETEGGRWAGCGIHLTSLQSVMYCSGEQHCL